ncbi:MAG: hypothetical protein FD150_883 [Rhodobacteraceae bacterium]|nr:MAG: hypothetical protein FD150_883 [Paracoccaceae bacterium]
MLDRKYLLGLLILVALTFRAGFLVIALPIGVLVLLGWLGLTLFEAVASFIGPMVQRDLITFRQKPKRGTALLIRHLGLNTPQTEAVLTEKAKALAQAVRTVNLRHPNPITGPVRLDQLSLVLHKAHPPENGAFPLALHKAWINPEPNTSTLGGLILMLRQRLGQLLFPRLSAEADQAMAIWPILSNGRTNQSTEAEPWKMVHYNDRALYEIRASLAEAAGFDRV